MSNDLDFMTTLSVLCDRCDRIDESLFSDRARATAELSDAGWVFIPDAPQHHRQFCPSCAEMVTGA
ncbi:hypothetical protein FB459_2128 [Yimella lutea]|uniref:Uncharacterized protein n=1 Tax=Yimella lutea TaxID=587872 RepID=A0A542EH71_9MICO|nr:hypothetical protein [Yimella lutea]TQJ14654.1 hypothetical protein FB459_2128 [Yimella lutea]